MGLSLPRITITHRAPREVNVTIININVIGRMFIPISWSSYFIHSITCALTRVNVVAYESNVRNYRTSYTSNLILWLGLIGKQCGAHYQALFFLANVGGYVRQTTIIWILFSWRHLYRRSMWFDVANIMDAKNPCVGHVFDNYWIVCSNMITII